MTPSAGGGPKSWKLVVWFSALTCLGQVIAVEGFRRFADRLVFLSDDYIWMTLLANLIMFAAAAVILDLVTRRLSHQWRVEISFAVFLFLALIGFVLLVPGLHRFAAIILTAGVGVQGARILWTYRGLFGAVVNHTVWAAAALVILSHVGVRFSRDILARPTQPIVSAPAGSPNVILIVLDTVRAENLSLYGYSRETTPMLSKFARTGVTFERAFSTAPWTLPSHATMFTGRLPNEMNADWLTRFDATFPTLSEVFGARGYRTAGFSANLLYVTVASGLTRGFSHFEDYPISWPVMMRNAWLTNGLLTRSAVFGMDDARVRKHAPDVNAEALAWLSTASKKPFFVFLNYFDAHGPYRTPPPYNTRFGPGGIDNFYLSEKKRWSAEELRPVVDSYDSTLAYLDLELGRLFDTLDARGLLDNTLVVVTSDHGQSFGEHGLAGHGNSLYRSLLQVPLIITFRGRVPEGVRVGNPVSLADLAATILDLAGVSGAPLPGRSLVTNWQVAGASDRPGRPLFAAVTKGLNRPEWEPVSNASLQSVIVNGMHYIRHSDGREELYDVDRDIPEINDLSSQPDARSALDEARQSLDALLK